MCLLSVVCVASGWRQEAHGVFPGLSQQPTLPTLIAHPGRALVLADLPLSLLLGGGDGGWMANPPFSCQAEVGWARLRGPDTPNVDLLPMDYAAQDFVKQTVPQFCLGSNAGKSSWVWELGEFFITFPSLPRRP